MIIFSVNELSWCVNNNNELRVIVSVDVRMIMGRSVCSGGSQGVLWVC